MRALPVDLDTANVKREALIALYHNDRMDLSSEDAAVFFNNAIERVYVLGMDKIELIAAVRG